MTAALFAKSSTQSALQHNGADAVVYSATDILLPPAVAGVASVNGGQLAGLRNRIINGGCLVAQRAAPALTASGQYGAVDRMMVGISSGTGISAGTANVFNVSGTSSGFACGAYQATYTAGQVVVQQRIELRNTLDLNGKTITVSGKIYHDFGSTISCIVRIDKPTVPDNFTSTATVATSGAVSCPSGAATSFSFTTTLGASDASNGLQVLVYDNASRAVTLKSFGVGDLQLEVGSTATTFEQRPYGMELALCQRYYEKSFTQDVAPANGANATSFTGTPVSVFSQGIIGNVSYRFVVVKRSSPTITYYGNNTGQVYVANTGAAGTWTTVAGNLNSSAVDMGIATYMSSGVFQHVSFHFTASAEL